MMTESRVWDLVGRSLGDYEFLERIGTGGMGVVYRARDRSLDRDVAIKVMRPELCDEPEFEKRFLREARTAAQIDHPNVVQIHAATRVDDVFLIAMQLVKGDTLARLQIERGGRFGMTEALKIVRQAAAGLEAAHKASLVHRDIKPTNIMVDEAGHVKIMDFGLMRSSLPSERITQSGDFFGTPAYAAPEQVGSGRVDGRADIYSLGAVLYEMVTGQVPHSAETPLALLRKISEEDPVDISQINPEIPGRLSTLVRRMMARNPEERHSSCGALIADIDRLLAGSDLPEFKSTLTAAAPARGRRVMAVGSAVLAVSLLAAVAWVVASAHPAPQQPAVPMASGGRVQMVVFDFKNGTGDAAHEWYEIALSDLLIAALAQRPWAGVATRDQILWKFKDVDLGRPLDEGQRRRILVEFGAAVYATGSFYVRNGSVRIIVNGYRTSDNSLAFASIQRDGPEAELFALIDDVAAGVERGLIAEKPATVAAAPSEPPTSCRQLRVAWKGYATPAVAVKAARRDASREKKEAESGDDAAPYAGAASPALGPESVRPWYHGRRMLEKSGCDTEEFELLLADLVEPFRQGTGDESKLEAFRRTVKELVHIKQKGRFKLGPEHVSYSCPPCGETAPGPAPCPKCGRDLARTWSLAPPAEKEQ